MWLGRIATSQPLNCRSKSATRFWLGADGNTALLEHPAVITLGRYADPAHVLLPMPALRTRGIEVCRTSRGGT